MGTEHPSGRVAGVSGAGSTPLPVGPESGPQPDVICATCSFIARPL